ncbi:hypothetical protein B0T14DRAFT_143757 [Immersiella caudata]|uniref:Uncharacterized protein n=1 Tax=Immersiella caudata TaxID=314043 RepID=A0AA39X5V5_9PEZI|nr:hypothetical protein B0T14DRAFT_143757 [Immersiella caudata]
MAFGIGGKARTVLGIDQNASNDANDQHHPPSGLPPIGPSTRGSQAQTEAVVPGHESRGKGAKLLKGIKKPFSRGGKKVDNVPSRPGQQPSNMAQAGEIDDDLATASTSQSNQETERQTHHGPGAHGPTLPPLQGHGDNFSVTFPSQHNQHEQQHTTHMVPTNGIPPNHINSPQFQPQLSERYRQRFSDTRDVMVLQGELTGTSAPTHPVMERSRPVPHHAGTYELADTGAQRPKDMQTTAARFAFTSSQARKQSEGLPAAPPFSAGAIPGAVAPTGGQPPPTPQVPPPRRRKRRRDFLRREPSPISVPSPPQKPPPQEPLAQRPLPQGLPSAPLNYGLAGEELEQPPPNFSGYASSSPFPASMGLPSQQKQTDLESRAKAYLERQNVPLDPVHDVLSNLTSWCDRERDHFRKELEEVRAQNQEALRSFSTERQELQQELERTKENFQTVKGQAHYWAKENKRKEDRINQLINELEASRNHHASADARWKHAEEAHRKAERELKSLHQTNETNVQEIDDLRSQLQALNSRLSGTEASHAGEMKATRRKHEEQLAAERQQHAREWKEKDQHWSEATRKLRDKLTTQEQQQARELEERDQHWSEAVRKVGDKLTTQQQQQARELEQRDHQMALLIEKHTGELKSMEDQMTAMESHYQQMLAKVEGSIQTQIDRAQREDRATIGKQRQQIASYSKDSYVPIDDSIFVKSFQAIVQDINRLASQIRLPHAIDFDPALDPTGCLDRNAGQRNWIWPRFVRHLCWQILLRGFFSLPFGFGALGHKGDGYNELQRMYQATARLVLTDDIDPTVAMPNEKDVNSYRASYMEKILSSVRSEAAITSKTVYAAIFHKNVDVVSRELYDTLYHIVNGQLNPACLQQVFDVTHKVGILALEMGTQRARVWLETCHYREYTTHEEWKTEEMGATGTGVMVDLMVHPCLSRVGDGRGDLDKKKVVVKGEFVPLRR